MHRGDNAGTFQKQMMVMMIDNVEVPQAAFMAVLKNRAEDN